MVAPRSPSLAFQLVRNGARRASRAHHSASIAPTRTTQDQPRCLQLQSPAASISKRAIHDTAQRARPPATETASSSQAPPPPPPPPSFASPPFSPSQPSASATSAQTSSPSDQQIVQVRDLLLRTFQLVAPSRAREEEENGQADVLRDEVWARRLERAREDLGLGGKAGRVRVAVVGSRTSGTAELVTALLDEPFQEAAAASAQGAAQGTQASSSSVHNALRQRHALGRGRQALRISYAPELGSSPDLGELDLPHEWLRESNIEIVEMLDPELSQNTLDTLYACDALFFVSDTYALDERVRATPALRASTYLQPSLRLLAHFADKPGTRLLVNRTAIAGAEDAPDLSHVVDGLSSAESAEDGALDVAQAVEAAVGHAAFSKLQRQAIATASPALAAIASATDSAPAGIVPISAHAATRANEALRQALGPAPGPASEPAAPAARLWDQFRTLYTASNLAGVRGLVRAPPLSKSGPPLSPSQRGAALALQTAGFVLRHAVDEATEAALAAQAELRRAEGQAAVLASDVDAILSSLSQRILPSDGVDSSEAVHAASGAATRRRAGDRSKEKRGVLADSQGEVERTLSARLQWWKLPVKVDDVRAETEAAVERSFASKLEVQLVFEAGRLLSVAEEQARRTTVALDALASPQTPQSEATEAGLTRESAPASTTHRARRPFDSPVLRNALRAYSPMHAERALVPSALSHPIASRRAQLLAPGGPLDVLALRAQRLVLTSYTLAAGASVAAYFSAALAESFGLAALALQPGTAGATALLAIAATAWRLQGGWTKAKRRFWKDWDRLASGLDYDLQANLQTVLRSHVLAQPLVAADGIRALAARRRRAVEQAASRVTALREELARAKLLERRSEESKQ